MLPREIAVIHCSAHTNAMDEISQGNHRADLATRQAAMTPLPLRMCAAVFVPGLEKDEVAKAITPEEKTQWVRLYEATEQDELWWSPQENRNPTSTGAPGLRSTSISARRSSVDKESQTFQSTDANVGRTVPVAADHSHSSENRRKVGLDSSLTNKASCV